MTDLAGKTILVTGGSRGIGAAIASTRVVVMRASATEDAVFRLSATDALPDRRFRDGDGIAVENTRMRQRSSVRSGSYSGCQPGCSALCPAQDRTQCAASNNLRDARPSA